MIQEFLKSSVVVLGCWVLQALLGSRLTYAHQGNEFGFSTSGEGSFFIRGDSDQNGKLEITDAIFTLGYLYLGTEAPYCLDALDTDDDGNLNVTDAISALGYLFNGSNAIAMPFPGPGLDPTPDSLNCDNGVFAHIRREVFATTCTTISCHSRDAAKGGLVLEGMLAYSQLYQVKSSNSAANAAGLLRVNPGKPEESFLYKKVANLLSEDEGKRMPDELGRPLSQAKIDLIQHWIRDGAVPSTTDDIILPKPFRGEQLSIPPFPVPPGKEIQRNYYFKLKNEEEIWINRVEFLYPPGSHHLNLFTGAPKPYEDGYFEDDFKVVPFGSWSLRASSQQGRLQWRLPSGVGMRMEPHQQILAQIHFVNIGSQVSPVGGCAAINLHTMEFNPQNPPMTLGSLFLQNKNIRIPPETEEISFDYGITLDHYNHNVPVKLAAVTGHFHWRGKKFEIRLWDGLNRKADGSPQPGEFDRMGGDNTIYLSDNWDEPPFILYGDDGPAVPQGWGVIYRTTYANATDRLFCFGPHVETQEHANAFIYFYPGPAESQGFLWFPPDCLGQGCTVPCF